MYRVTTNGLFISCDSNGNKLRLTEVDPFLMTAEEIATAFEHEKEYIKSRQQQQKGVVLLSTPKREKVLSTPKREKEITETPTPQSASRTSSGKKRGRKRVYEDRLPINFMFSDNRAQKDVYVMVVCCLFVRIISELYFALYNHFFTNNDCTKFFFKNFGLKN